MSLEAALQKIVDNVPWNNEGDKNEVLGYLKDYFSDGTNTASEPEAENDSEVQTETHTEPPVSPVNPT